MDLARLPDDHPRVVLDRLARERGDDYASLSRLLRRNPAYVQQFIKRGSPRKLDEADRATLARYFGVAEAVLAGRDALPLPRGGA
ncbi:MAG: peptidase S24, partial [Sphingomonadales bacterium]|nr:peptidase S24 [Sphingomonadales bacterium]